LNTFVDRQYIENLKPDAVIIATGARPNNSNIAGADSKHVLSVREVLRQPSIIDKNKVVIVGGGTVGAEIAELLWARDKEVTVLEMSRGIAKDMGSMLRFDFRKRTSKTGILFVTGATVTEITPNSVIYKTKDGEQNIEADAIILAVGYLPENYLAQELSDINAEIIVVGDALSPRKIMDAVHEGFHAARRLNYCYNEF
jgi:pyruvate/2-oxoglutarate dehydrogenase complex dihydrolipoamide dehydrogenase (E3) component